MKKLILCDIDGTMVINDSISKENIEAVKRLQDNGHFVTLATGRHYTRAIEVMQELNIDLPMISSNGAVIYHPVEEKILKSYYIDSDALKACISVCKRESIEYILYTEETMKASQKAIDELHKLYIETNVDIINLEEEKDLIDSNSIVKILAVEYNEDKLLRLEKELNEIDKLHCNISDPGLLNIGSDIATKGNGLKYLMDYLNVDKANTIALGNADNDISMIEVASVGVCVGNDSLALKKKSDVVKEDNLEIAFSEVMNDLGL